MILSQLRRSGARLVSRMGARRAWSLPAMLVPLVLGGCHSAAQRAEADTALADQLMAAKAYPAAAAALDRATQYDGNNPQLWLKLGHADLQAGDYAGADQAFQHAVELAPDNVEGLENLVILSVRAGLIDHAKRFMTPLLLLQPDNPAGLLAQGAIALRERRYADALANADRLVATVPDLAEAYMLRARALAAQHRPADATALLERRVALDPGGQDAMEMLTQLLDLYRGQRDVAAIRRTALRLHALDPTEPRYALESARALHAQGHDDQAGGIVADLLRAHPGSLGVTRAVVAYFRSTLPPQQARDRTAALVAGASPAVRVAIAEALVDMGAADRALSIVGSHARDAVDAGNVDAVIASAHALAALGRTDDARARLDRVLAFDSGNVAALIARARIRLARRDGAGALADAQLAWSSDATSAAAAMLVAQVHAAQGDGVLAQQAYAQAVQAFPDSFDVLADYLDWLQARGRTEDAAQAAGSFARRHPHAPAAWRRYLQLCRAAGSACATEAGQGLASVA